MTSNRQTSGAISVPLALLLDPAQPLHGVTVYGAFLATADATATSYATAAEISQQLGMPTTTLNRTLAGLVELGWIVRRRAPGSNRYATTLQAEPTPA